MADYFDSSWREDSFGEANAPRFVDFNDLNNDDLGNRSAWFDSHESFYADATFLQSPAPKKRHKKTATAKEARSTTRRVKAKPASLARPLQPVRPDEKEDRKQRKRAASCRPHHEEPAKEKDVKGKEKLIADKENANSNVPVSAPPMPITDSHTLLKKLPISPVPEAKKIESVDQLNRRLLDQIEEKRRIRRQASLLAPALAVAPPPMTEADNAAPLTSSEAEVVAVEKDEAELAPAVTRTAKLRSAVSSSRTAASARAGQGRTVGKQVPVGKVLQRQRMNRLENEMVKQRERAKSQREQQHNRSEKIEAAKKQRELEKEQQRKERNEQAELLKRQREQEKEQRLKEKERREAEERERKMARFEEKQHRTKLPLHGKQVRPLTTAPCTHSLTLTCTDASGRVCHPLGQAAHLPQRVPLCHRSQKSQVPLLVAFFSSPPS
jgi:hypothetical protein